MVWRNRQNFMILQNAFYLCSMPKGGNEDLLLFIVPKAHWTTTLNGCHRDVVHQGHEPYPILTTRMLLVARNVQPDEAIY